MNEHTHTPPFGYYIFICLTGMYLTLWTSEKARSLPEELTV